MKKDIRLAGIVQGQEEIDAVMRVLKTDPPWHVSGPECNALQKELADYIGVKYCIVVNSGSSANLLALNALGYPKGSKVLTAGCGFPATLNPIIHLGHYPIIVDYNLETLNADLRQIEFAFNTIEDIKCAILAHTLGNPLEMEVLLYLCKKYHIDLIEDACEAIGSEYNGMKVGSFGKINTVSFYSSHQISGFGGGGAILTNDKDLYEKCKSLRDWGKQNVREGYITTVLDTEVDGIPYDQQYTYETIGYNMRFPDANCAYAREQLKRLPMFCTQRYNNYTYLNQRLNSFRLPLRDMRYSYHSRPAFFGYPIVVKDTSKRDKLVNHLENNGVHVRLFFAGNILRHKAYKDIEYLQVPYGSLTVADYLMENAFFVGCWPGLTYEDMEYTANTIKEFFND
jgi:CDP-6-deoxy-D-xylo-4-hexulose-3-dehydrase